MLNSRRICKKLLPYNNPLKAKCFNDSLVLIPVIFSDGNQKQWTKSWSE